MANFAGWQKHLHLAKETSWGTLAAEPEYVYVPYANYNVRVNVQASQAQLFTGLRQRRHNRITKATLQGTLECPLFGHYVGDKSLAEILLSWLDSAPASIALDSYTAESFEAGVDNKRHLGMRTNSGTLSGSADSGFIQLSLELSGRSEVGGISAQSLDPEAPAPVDFLFKDAVFSINGDPVELRSFDISINNNVQVYHTNSYWPTLSVAGVREVSYSIMLYKSDSTYDAMRRSPPADTTGQLVLKGAHRGTGPEDTNYTTVTIDFPRLAFTDVGEDGGINDLQGQSPKYIALKPSTSSNEIVISYGAVE